MSKTSAMNRVGVAREIQRDRVARSRAAEFFVARELGGGLRDAFDPIGDVMLWSPDGRQVVTVDVKSVVGHWSFVNGGDHRPRSIAVVVSWLDDVPSIYGVIYREDWIEGHPPVGSRPHVKCWYVMREQIDRKYWLVLQTPGREGVEQAGPPPGGLSTDDVSLAEWIGLPETRDPNDPELRAVVQRRIWRDRKRRQVERSRNAPAPLFPDLDVAPPAGRPRHGLANTSHPGRGSKLRDPDELCATCRVARAIHRDWRYGGSHDFAV